MKKTLLSVLMMASCFGVANAQLMVDEKCLMTRFQIHIIEISM